jgi:hypothetical protein
MTLVGCGTLTTLPLPMVLISKDGDIDLPATPLMEHSDGYVDELCRRIGVSIGAIRWGMDSLDGDLKYEHR